MPPLPQEKTIALIVAAGKSERMQSDTPKQYLLLNRESILRRTVKTFLSHPMIDGVRVVIRREHHMAYKREVEGLTLFPCVMGGDSRQESVRRGLESLRHRMPRNVLIHDVARPMVSHALITRTIEALENHEAVLPALPITDTVKRASGGTVAETLPREELFTVQTPQGFHYEAILAAHEKLRGQALPDDAALVEKLGGKVTLIAGEADNFKLTTEADYNRMRTMLSNDTETRVGIGYDVHVMQPFGPDTPVARQYIKLCGIKIPFTHYLVGHSDADVGMHALVDAIFGALGDGDIGTHFPPDDQKWKGADSDRFLLHAYERVAARGGRIGHLDVTIVCEKPKISPHREIMAQHIAQMLKLDISRVSVKATTTEKLGFTGRGEGIAAQAVASIILPRS
ncbi:MAG: bifunctional 2-C-methyl-D-erythritol 4-phosphate cytidylyltransferase/2-C-methyl-D-erythritol 2,4-cyclodiphosphate synthase [Alphaproteobacteria bacterium]|nr:bifunctional 2-C-methyl-D-erythritol 4-phosphate cytidylyltransferase/2-C-methyl-D-erythritol 2,4-cyclodiphosphate synthase [Alphaproteobacteria bacterium]